VYFEDLPKISMRETLKKHVRITKREQTAAGAVRKIVYSLG